MAGSLEGSGGTTQATYQFGLDWWIRALSGGSDHLSTASPFPQEGRSQAVAATVKFLEAVPELLAAIEVLDDHLDVRLRLIPERRGSEPPGGDQAHPEPPRVIQELHVADLAAAGRQDQEVPG
jgi:hypothetical protein